MILKLIDTSVTPMQAPLPATGPDALVRAARQYGNDIALEEGGRRWTYRELEAEVRRAAAGFMAAGLGHGDRVAIWAPNIGRWIVAALGAQAVGGIVVPLNTRLRGREAAYILNRSGTRVLVHVGELLGTRYADLLAGESLPRLERRIVIDGPEWDEFLAAGAAISGPELDARLARLRAEDVADILFTSGTTGQPKGVMSSHTQNIRVFDAWSTVVGLRHGDRYLIVNPFFHAFGYKSGWLACLLRGATILPQAVFDADVVLRRIVDDHISVLPGPPTLFQSLLTSQERAPVDVSSLRLAVTGAASVPVRLIERMSADLGFRTVVTGYGLTESTGCVSICRPGDTPERIAHTCGAPIPGVEVRVADEAGREVPRGAEGELLVRGYNVMLGYFEDEAATRAAIDADGWLHTGDIGVMDEEGYLRITDRKKDMFIVGGFNCYPAEIENLLAAHPAIAQVAVVGAPDERMGEVGHAYVVLRPGATLDEPALIAWSRANMANYKVPRRVHFVAELPTTASGKVQRFALRGG
ncbi:MAG: 3-[(3aS,4S,7aS)-7a-methyl-1,5-dioxo-octahydro-1H-inden-4-yl]propanoyl:CoA ligase [Steroidobacteraceae bacterium]|nr:3-[(3aS,4S,7aS)-7a-methyl-1,5-dioxo-octahydro-1H-inden-4-yl]propanoyl:CoA ligase [Steroidobacteraceae bacterium]